MSIEWIQYDMTLLNPTGDFHITMTWYAYDNGGKLRQVRIQSACGLRKYLNTWFCGRPATYPHANRSVAPAHGFLKLLVEQSGVDSG